jgi:hypothetical protein
MVQTKAPPEKVLQAQSLRAASKQYVKSIWQSWSFQVVEQGCRAHSKGLTGTIQRQIQTATVVSSGGAYEMR